eukprot:PhM_4_TR5967/c0_g1_i4/m.3899
MEKRIAAVMYLQLVIFAAVFLTSALALSNSKHNDFNKYRTPNYPARGWNTYDAFGLQFNESAALTQLSHLAPYVQSANLQYFIIDEGWALENPSDSTTWVLDAFGRPTYNPKLYPSGMAALAQKLRDGGMELGLWMIRGVPELAVQRRLPIKGTNYTVADIAVAKYRCPWHSDVMGINTTHPGAQAYYDSVVELYKSWGVTYLKADCEFGTRDMINGKEIALLSNSVKNVDPSKPVRLGLSPGVNAELSEAKSIFRLVNSYRITDDLWDCWSPKEPCGCGDGISVLSASIPQAVTFASMIGDVGLGGRSFLDLDSFGFGLLGLGGVHESSYTPSQVTFIYTLWSLVQSIAVLGGDMTATPPHVASLYMNTDLTEVHSVASRGRSLLYNSTNLFWRADHESSATTWFVGVWAFDALSNATWVGQYHFADYDAVGGVPSAVSELQVYCMVQQRVVGTWERGSAWTFSLPANSGTILKLTTSKKTSE